MDMRDLLYKCLECNKQEIVRADNNIRDGRRCRICKGKLEQVGYLGLDLANEVNKSSTHYTHRVKKSNNSKL
ncbi:hypothetical protein [Clostridium paridis]|uniref:Uncharacterized protein n=1 Tax=Clostridium paridis TaxID=2803863 RepID=A0A937K3I4_9CLOT|nr:hypothetical protein [Clostridium paridis]MBL4930809.1 hypothetical protein [Clostridium paridis]